MKKLFLVLSVLLLTMMASTAIAQVKAGSVNVTPYIGFYKFENNEDTNSGPALGLRLGYYFTKYIGLEGYAHFVPTELQNPAFSVNGRTSMNFIGYGLEGIINLLPDKELVPFIALGVGGVSYSEGYNFSNEEHNNKFAAGYGAGLKYFLSENVAARVDVRHILPLTPDDRHNNLLAAVGLTFAFGGAKKAVEPPPAPAPVIGDEDKDGVPDNLDKCPGTPAGVQVDKDGCPLDSDGDGVPDYLDKCPGTPAGVKVDKDGCPPPVVQTVKPQPVAAPEIIEKGRTTLKVLFDTNKDIIKKNSFKDVDNLVSVMKQYPDLDVIIEGHTDNVGGAAFNKKLSQKRADAVKKYMVAKGVDAKRINTIGYGLEKPIADNKTKEGRAQNRRVEAAVDYMIKKK